MATSTKKKSKPAPAAVETTTAKKAEITTKSVLVRAIAAELKLPINKTDEIVSTVFKQIKKAIKRGPVRLNGFGSFNTHAVKERDNAVNPRNTDEVMTVPAHTRVSFRPGKQLKDFLNAVGKKSKK